MLHAAVLALSVLPLHPSGDFPNEAARGASLLRGCQAELRLMELATLDEASSPDLINGAYCVGYLNGFTANLEPGTAAICPRAQPMGTLVRAYVSYMERNPRLQDEDKRLGLRLALQDAFPCQAAR